MASNRHSSQPESEHKALESQSVIDADLNDKRERAPVHSTNQSKKNQNSSSANVRGSKGLKSELKKKEQLVSTLKEDLANLAEQLEFSQRANEDLTAAENSRTKELEAELQEKEQLVVLLTERLEQVAEQLDRRHRTGADRGMTISGGLPPEVIEEQQKFSQDLQTILEQVQGSETESSLTRIELQIAELKQLVITGFENGSTAPQETSLVDYLASPSIPVADEEASNRTEVVDTQEEPLDSASSDDTSDSGWEAMKEKLLSGQGVDVSQDLKKEIPSPSPPVTPQPPAAGSFVPEPSQASGRTVGSYKPPLPEAPSEINYAQASHEQFAQAISERDKYISLLIKRVREAESAVIPVNWEQLNNVPEELVARVQSLQHDLEHNLGLAEVEISIERARLSRTESMLQNREEQIRKQEKQLGLNLERSEESIVAETELSDERKKSWLGFLN